MVLKSRVLLQIVIFYLLGILAMGNVPYVIIPLAAILMGLLVRGRRPRRLRIEILLLLTGAFSLGLGRTWQMEHLQDHVYHACKAGREITIAGRITAKALRDDKVSYTLSDSCLIKDDLPLGRVVIYPREEITIEDYAVGSYVTASGSVSYPENGTNEGGYMSRDQLAAQGICIRLSEAAVVVERKPLLGYAEGLFALRQKMKKVFEDYLPGEESGLVTAMTLGDKEALGEDVSDLFRLSGLAHMMAISGMHVSLVGMSIHKLLKKMKCSNRLAAMVAGGLILSYCLMTGNSLSSRRAAWMLGISLLASVPGEAYDSLAGISFAGLVMLLANPMSVYSAGFRFSFIAVSGLVLVAIPLTEQYSDHCRMRWRKKNPIAMSRGDHWRPVWWQRLMRTLIFSVGIQLATLPVIAETYYQIPVYVIGLNMILLPFCAFLIGFGLLGGLCGVACIYLPLLWPVRDLCLYLVHIIIRIYETAAYLSLSLPQSRWITGKPPVWVLPVYFVILLGFVYGRKRRCLPLAGLCIMVLLVVAYPLPHPAEITMLDVGQGDGIYLCDGEGHHYMIDGGSTTVDRVGKYRLLPFLKCRGVRRVDIWFISHTDADHCNGILEAMDDDYPIGLIVFSKTMEEEVEKEEKLLRGSRRREGVSVDNTQGLYRQILQKAAEHGIPVKTMQKGMLVDMPSEQMDISCLYPGSYSHFSGINENCLALKIQSQGLCFIAAGDIGKDQEEYICKTQGKALKNQGLVILKADHHGSNFSNSKKWLETISPDQVWISAGAHNKYGHPGREALNRLQEAGIPYQCTIYTGQITVQYSRGRWKMYLFKEE